MENSATENYNYNRGTQILIGNENIIELKDDYDHIDNSIEYIIENELMTDNKTDAYKELKELYNQTYTKGCLCKNDNCSSLEKCCHSQNYILSNNELILNKSRLSIDLIYECSINCKCTTTCLNRLVQFGPREHLKITEIFYDLNKQLGLACLVNIPEGGFVCEYIGEILTKDEAIGRNQFNDKYDKINYIICLNETCSDSSNEGIGQQTFIDPSLRGNIGRYLNHSCDPNCEIISVRTDGIIPKLGIFAKRHIKKMEELCFDYGCSTADHITLEKSINRKKCYCQSVGCRQYLPNFSY